MFMYILFLTLLLSIIIYSAATGGSSYKILEQATNTQKRQKIYRSWIRESWLLFGVVSVAGIALLLQTDQTLQLSFNSPTLESVGTGMAFGLIVVLLLAIAYSWRQSTTISKADRNKIKSLINKSGSGGLIAKNHEERTLGGVLSLAAGVTEELFFRLVLPAVMVVIFGTEWLVPIVIISALLFGLAHAYQGISGVVLTSIIGALLMFIYISTGSILLAILVHILVDVRATVAMSWVAYGRTSRR